MSDDNENNDDEDLNPKKRGLGRGLNALFEDDEGVYPQPDEEGHTPGAQRKIVGTEQLEPNPTQPRKTFDEDALEELAESIAQHGVLQPLIVRPRDGFPDTYQIVAGERRWRAAQKAQVHEIPVIVHDLDDETVLEIALVENLQREDLNAVEEAEGYRRLLNQFGHTQEETAEIVGKSRSHVANTLRLLSLPEKVQDMVRDGKLSAGHARALVTADNAEAIAKKVIAEGLNVRQTEALMGGDKEESAKPAAKKKAKVKKDADTRALEEEVSNALGMKVSIDMSGMGSGSLSIAFDSLDQLDEILHRLSHYPGSRQAG